MNELKKLVVDLDNTRKDLEYYLKSNADNGVLSLKTMLAIQDAINAVSIAKIHVYNSAEENEVYFQ